MDIQEIKKYSKNKIEADDLTKQVRQRIKETAWEKQNRREGFTETFRPLISQFEKPEDPKKKNIFTQNQEMLRNQLALTEGIKNNQLALKGLTDKQDIFNRGFKQYERMADFEELPGVEAIDYDQEQTSKDLIDFDDDQEKTSKIPIAKFNVEDLNKYLNNKKSKDILKSNYGYDNLPSYYFDKNISEISSLIDNVTQDLIFEGNNIKNTATIYHDDGYNLAKPIAKNPQDKTLENIKNYNVLSIYLTNLNLLAMYKKQSGTGMFYFSSPEELIKRFDLLGGSLAAGNNGVLPEYIQIAHQLRDLGVVTNKQLNILLRKFI